jgi:hypothetical protein
VYERAGIVRFHRDPDGYLALRREEVPDYERLQDRAGAATGTAATRVLELDVVATSRSS